MRPFMLAGFVCLMLTAQASAQEPSNLTPDELKAIIAKPHDDQPAVKGFEILPDIRNWDSTGGFTDPAGKREPFKGKTTSRRVEGKYEVNEITFEGLKVKLVLVVTWDPKSDMYYRYLVTPRGPVSKSLGMRVPNARSIAWAEPGGGGLRMMTVENYEDKKMTWRSLSVDKSGAVTLTTEGEATAAKE